MMHSGELRMIHSHVASNAATPTVTQTVRAAVTRVVGHTSSTHFLDIIFDIARHYLLDSVCVCRHRLPDIIVHMGLAIGPLLGQRLY